MQVYSLDSSKSKCGAGFYLNSDFGATISITGTPLLPGEPANPCGKMAKSYFTDTYSLSSIDPTTSLSAPIAISETGIVEPYIKKFQFHNSKKPETQHIDYKNDEHFMVWSQMETLNSFLKPWGIISQDLTQGKYSITTDNCKYNNQLTMFFISMVKRGCFFLRLTHLEGQISC